MKLIAFLPVAASVAALAALPAAAAGPSGSQFHQVTISPRTLTIGGSPDYRPGPVTFRVRARGGEQVFHLLQLDPGYTLADLRAEHRHGDSVSVERRVLAHVRFLGGADVFPGAPTAFTQTLRPGTYYVGTMDSRLRLQAIHVHGAPVPASTAPAATGTITGYDFGWRVSGTLPAHGTIVVHNRGHQGEVLVLSPARPGTTRAQLGTYLRRTGASEQAPPPAFGLPGPSAVTGLISPGVSMELSYDLPSGRYVLLTFARDIRNGKPLALEGMYAVATLR